MSIWDVGSRTVVVEKRKITPRERKPRPAPATKYTPRKPVGPLALQVSRMLKANPLAFPNLLR